MLDKSVPLLSPPEFPQKLLVGSVLDDRMLVRVAIFMNDLRQALEYFRFELEGISESLRRQELRYLIRLIDEQARTKPRYFLQGSLDVYLDICDMARRNTRCNSYRTRYGAEVKKDLDATMAFVYMAGTCRGALMDLYNSGEYITDEAIKLIIDSLPVWEH